MTRIESLLSARQFVVPQLAGQRLYFLSNLSGHLSLYAMDHGGSVPEPLLPPHIALQNPHLMGGESFVVFPKLGQILVMIDQNGDENYQPMLIAMDGDFPEAVFGDQFKHYRVHCGQDDLERNLVYFSAESRQEPMVETFQANLETGTLLKMGQSRWGMYPLGVSKTHDKAILAETYTAGDHVLYLWTRASGQPQLLYGTPLADREAGQEVPINAIANCHFTGKDEMGLLFTTALFTDTYSLGYMHLANPEEVKPVTISGAVHQGVGELVELRDLKDDRYALTYNIDGSSWLYEGRFEEEALEMRLEKVICGRDPLSNGVLESYRYDEDGDRYALSFSTATSPIQLYTVGGDEGHVIGHSRERILGIADDWLASGEDASYTSHDGLRVSARLYLPAGAFQFQAPYPLVYYVHGGPQSQERPDFAWFSMPLIQFLTLNGFAVFVPNVRGSTGYGLSYMKQVDRDWGGRDMLDHVQAMKALAEDKRLDTGRTGVVGRSYGGYMTLMLASRYPELWSAAVDMFGPYDLLTFIDRLPETWKPYFAIAVGDPEKDRDFLVERSPRTSIDQITCPLMVIQGKNDPRVIEQESRDLVENLRSTGKQVEYLVFEDEGHDVLKFDNRVRCYNAITDFFKEHLRP